MEQVPLEENTAARKRLNTIVASLNDDDLAQPVSPGRTVAVHLAQLAFWDSWAQQLIARWRTGQLPPPTVPPWYDEMVNSALLATWQALPGATAARLAVAAAEAADLEVAHAETPVLAGIIASGESNLLNRHLPRDSTLSRIEAALHRG